MPKKIQISMNRASLKNAISELQSYKQELKQKENEYLDELCDIAVKIINQRISQARGDSDKDVFVNVVNTDIGGNVGRTIFVNGTDILFIEFGAGIHYNNGNTNPKASEFGYGVGTYPGQTHAINPGYWWYKDDDGKLHLSYGTEATMPVYNAELEIMKVADQIAVEVFGR